MTVRFRKSELTRAALAMKDAGVDCYDITFGPDGAPILRVRPRPANDTPQDVIDEIEALRREIEDDAA